MLNELRESGTLTRTLIAFLEDSDATVASYAMSVFLQVCTKAYARDMLWHILDTLDMTSLICSLIQSVPYAHNRMPYLRGVLISAALCRQDNWWSYNPASWPQEMSPGGMLETMIYMDFLKTLKGPTHFSTQRCLESHNLASLAVMDTRHSAAVSLSLRVSKLGAQSLANFFCHPEDAFYFSSLPWDKRAAATNILEGLSKSALAASGMYSDGTLLFLAQCIIAAKDEFSDTEAALSENRVTLLLTGAAAAMRCLTNICDCDRPSDDTESLNMLNTSMKIQSILGRMPSGSFLSKNTDNLSTSNRHRSRTSSNINENDFKISTKAHQFVEHGPETKEFQNDHLEGTSTHSVVQPIDSQALIDCFKSTGVVSAISFFIGTLSTRHMCINDSNKNQQERTGIETIL